MQVITLYTLSKIMAYTRKPNYDVFNETLTIEFVLMHLLLSNLYH